MSRVLLFVRTMVSTPRFPDGDDRPKCVAWWDAAWIGTLMAVINNDPFGSVQFHALNRARKTAARWWLVKCENAEDGRQLIAMHESVGNSDPHGRIIASGGQP